MILAPNINIRHLATGSRVLHRLKFLKINFGHSSPCRVAVVKPTVNKNLYKRIESLSVSYLVAAAFISVNSSISKRKIASV